LVAVQKESVNRYKKPAYKGWSD